MSDFPVDKRSYSSQSSHQKRSDGIAHDSDSPVWPEPTTSPNPTSSLLQDLLREKKAQTQHNSRTYDVNGRRPDGQGFDLDSRTIQSSPLIATTSRERSNTKGRRSSAVGGNDTSVTKAMGVRETDQVMNGC